MDSGDAAAYEPVWFEHDRTLTVRGEISFSVLDKLPLNFKLTRLL